MESQHGGQADLPPTAAQSDPAVIRRHRRMAIIGLLAFVGLIAFAILRHHTAIRPGGLRHLGPMPVAVGKVTTADVPVIVQALGTVTPLDVVSVTPQVSGPLVRLPFKEGQMVRAGALLAQIDPRPFQAALAQAQGQLKTAEAALSTARLDLGRYKRLVAQDSIAVQTYADQVGTVQQDAATVEADKAAVETARLNLSYCRIVSPVAGLVGLRQVDVGNLVQANQSTPIVVVTQMQPMSVVFSVPETNLQQLFQRLRAGARLSVQAYSRDMRHRIATGTLTAIDNQINTTTGTLQMRAMFNNKRLELFPNEFVNVKLVVRTLKHQMVVPGGAVLNGPSGYYAFVVQPNDTVRMRPIVPGPTDGRMIAILRGLSPGETVVTDGGDQLREGARVRIPGQKAPPAAAAAGARNVRCARLAKARRTASGRQAKVLARAVQRLGCARQAVHT